MRPILKDSANHSEFFALVSSSTGLALTGVAFGSVTGSYARQRSARVAISVITLAAATTAYTSGGWFEIDAVNMPGVYRLDVPDAAFVTGADQVVVSVVVTGANTAHKEFRLTGTDDQDAVRYGLTALPNAAAAAAGGLFTRGTGPGQINQAADGMIDTNPVRLNNVSQSLLDLKDFADDGYDPSTNKVQGLVLADAVTAVSAGGITAASLAADTITAAKVAADVGVEFADALLDRDMGTGSDSGSPTVRTVRQALRALRNRFGLVGTTRTVYKEDDTTASWTSVVTTSPTADPITADDPA